MATASAAGGNRRTRTAAPARELTAEQALALRMSSLLLGGWRPPGVAGVAGIVEWLGAMQAQDLGSGLWSFGVRLPGLTCADVEAAVEDRQALRTWPMRGTVHFVPSRDARWMVELMGARPLAGAPARRARLGLSEQTADRAVEVLRQALTGGRRLTRAQCLATLAEAGIDHSAQRGYHLLWYASQRGVTCIAPNVAGEQTFVLLDEWVPDPVLPGREEALATIARRYFRGHGPATRRDFVGWTGLTAADARLAIAAASDTLATVRVEGQEMFLDRRVLESDQAHRPPDPRRAPALALPGFDEYLLGFKDRTLMINPGDLDAIIPGGNGMFRPTLVRAGRVAATWTKTTGRARVSIDVHPLATPSPSRSPGPAATAAERDWRSDAEEALAAYARFVGLPPVIRWT